MASRALVDVAKIARRLRQGGGGGGGGGGGPLEHSLSLAKCLRSGATGLLGQRRPYRRDGCTHRHHRHPPDQGGGGKGIIAGTRRTRKYLVMQRCGRKACVPKGDGKNFAKLIAPATNREARALLGIFGAKKGRLGGNRRPPRAAAWTPLERFSSRWSRSRVMTKAPMRFWGTGSVMTSPTYTGISPIAMVGGQRGKRPYAVALGGSIQAGWMPPTHLFAIPDLAASRLGRYPAGLRRGG